MSEFITAARVGQIPEGHGRSFPVGQREIAIFCVGGEYFALDNYCPHMGDSLACGDVRDGMVARNRHLWAFRLEDGSCPDAPTLKAETFPVRVQGEEIQVRLPDGG